jgi:ribosomal protein S18 acetylase RimI-like enzyme
MEIASVAVNYDFTKSYRFFALSEGKVTGFVTLNLEHKTVPHHVSDFYVEPEFRGKGVGHDLLSAAIKKAQSCGLSKVFLQVYERNCRARKLYRKFNFQDHSIHTGVDDKVVTMFLEIK